LARVGISADWVELPKLDIAGNRHVMMMDTNNSPVADVLQDWMMKQLLMK